MTENEPGSIIVYCYIIFRFNLILHKLFIIDSYIINSLYISSIHIYEMYSHYTHVQILTLNFSKRDLCVILRDTDFIFPVTCQSHVTSSVVH